MSEVNLNVVELPFSKAATVGHAANTTPSKYGVMPPAKPVENPSQGQVKDAVHRMNEYVQNTQRSLDFRVDEATGQTVIRVYDKSTDELIRQIPGELALQLAQRLNDEEPSLLFRAQV